MTNITSKYLNQDKREAEALTVTLPSVANVGGGRTQAAVTYNQFGEEYISYTVPGPAVLKKFYLVVEEAFPAGSTVEVLMGGTTIFTSAAVTSTGITVSTSEDQLTTNNNNISITVNGGTGDITTGLLRIVVDTVPYLEKNGRYGSYGQSTS